MIVAPSQGGRLPNESIFGVSFIGSKMQRMHSAATNKKDYASCFNFASGSRTIKLALAFVSPSCLQTYNLPNNLTISQ